MVTLLLLKEPLNYVGEDATTALKPAQSPHLQLNCAAVDTEAGLK